MVKRMLKRMGRKFNPARMGRKVGKWDIDPFVTRIQVPNGPQNVWTKHKRSFIYVGARGEEGIVTDEKSYHILPESVK